MEKRDKIIIAALIIVIVALIVGLASMFVNNSSADGGSIPDGMQKYNFDSAFTMVVPKNTRFLKEFNSSNEFGQGKSYYDRHNQIAVLYINSPLFTHNLVDSIANMANSSGNETVELDGDLVIMHSLTRKAKLGSTLENSNFTDSIIVQRGHEGIIIQGNDKDLIKTMAESVKWYE